MRGLPEIAAKPVRRVVGLMSGTSADGIDAVVAQIEGCGPGTRVRLLSFAAVPLPEPVRQGVFALFGDRASVDELCRLNFALGEAFAGAALAAIEAAGLRPGEVDLIGSHGQTVRHLPGLDPPSTLQIGEPAVIARRTGIATIADFRPADMAAGGQGAPLVPLVDFLLFGHPERGRLLLNLGGIANVTVLPAGAREEEVRAFDLGPGNMLVDGAVAHFTGGQERFDRDGRRAASGRVHRELLERLMAHGFLRQPPPKSTGREEFGAGFLAGLLAGQSLSLDDWAATLTAFTAGAVADGIRRFVLPRARVEEMWVSGGGVHNGHLMRLLAEGLPQVRVESLAGLGVDPDAKEALAFAVLANETVAGRCGNLPPATGARQAVVLGKIVLP